MVLVMELCHITMAQYIVQRVQFFNMRSVAMLNNEPFEPVMSEDEIRYFLNQLALGMKELREQHVCHSMLQRTCIP